MADPTTGDDWDQLTPHDLRHRGSLKWTGYGEQTLGAWVAEMDFGTAEPVTAALREAVGAGRFGYLPPAVASDLAQACADWQRQRYGWPVAPEQIHPISDVITAFALALAHFSRPGSPVIVPTPAYMPFLTVPGLSGRQVIQVPMVRDHHRHRLDPDAIAAAFRAGGHLLVLCNPANPVGRVFTADELAEVTEVVDRYGGRVFADEIHAPLTYPGHHHLPYASTSATAAAHTLTAVSASKAWNHSGLRCAQVILAPADEPTWQRVGTTGSVAASTLGAVASTAAYRSGQQWLRQLLTYLDGNRQALVTLLDQHLPGVGYQPPEGTYLAWLDCRALPIPAPAAEFFRTRGAVALVDGAECGSAGAGFIRLNFATPSPVLSQLVSRMAAAVTRAG